MREPIHATSLLHYTVKSFFCLAVVSTCLALFGSAKANLPEDPIEYREWEAKSMQAIASCKASSDDESYLKLGKTIYRLTLSFNQEKGNRPVFQAAREAMMSMPGYADYLRRSIEMAIQAEFAEAASNPEPAIERLDRYQSFEVLKYLPAPASVGLLGELLEDERDPWKGKQESDASRPPDNASFAVSALSKLGIERAVEAPKDFDSALKEWRRWYAEVKSGTKTFRFKGDPKEYNLNGPVTVAVSEGAQSNKSSAPAANPAAVSGETPAQRWPLWVALGVLAAGVVAYVGKRKVGRSGI